MRSIAKLKELLKLAMLISVPRIAGSEWSAGPPCTCRLRSSWVRLITSRASGVTYPFSTSSAKTRWHRKPREEKRAELELHDRLYVESAKYNFKQKEGPDENGSVKLTCPARGKSATVLCPLHVPPVLTKNRDRAIILNAPVDNALDRESPRSGPRRAWPLWRKVERRPHRRRRER